MVIERVDHMVTIVFVSCLVPLLALGFIVAGCKAEVCNDEYTCYHKIQENKANKRKV